MSALSLILATVDRVKEPAYCLATLARQSCKDFEVIVVDQNMDGRLDAMIAEYAEHISIKHIKTPIRGLSRARNLGLKAMQGDIVGFADDDGWYPADTVASVIEWFDSHAGYAGLSGCCLDADGRHSQVQWLKHAHDIDWRNAWRSLTSFSLFLRKSAVHATGEFDEMLGVGSGTPWGSAEEMDYALRILQQGLMLRYEPSIIVYHPPSVLEFDTESWRRARSYGGGMGRVIKKHRLPHWFFVRSLIRACGGCTLGLLRANTGMARFHMNVLMGRWAGWRSLK